MKTYNDSSWRKNPQLQGEFFVCPDPQERCYPEAWLVCQYWNPHTWKSEWDGQKWTTCPEIDIIELGIFWHRQSAISYAMLLEELEPKKLTYNDVCFGCMAKLEHIDVLESEIKTQAAEIERLHARDKRMAEAITIMADGAKKYVLSSSAITHMVFDEADSLVNYCEKLENMVIARDIRIKVLEDQVTTLKGIAAEERAVGNMYYNGIDFPDPSKDDLKEARDQLAGEHPEAFNDPD